MSNTGSADPGAPTIEQAIEQQPMQETGVNAATTAHVDVPAEAAATKPKALGLDATAWVALAMLGVLLIMIWKKVPGAIGRSLDAKIALIRQQLDEAKRLRADAEALRAEYEAKTAGAAAEAQAMLDRARTEAETIRTQAEADAASMVERRTRMAEDKIAAAERSAVQEVRTRAAQAAAGAAEQLIRERLDAQADRAMIDRTIAELGRTH